MRKVLYIITVFLIIAFAWVIYDLVSFNQGRQQTATDLGAITTTSLKNDVNIILEEVMTTGDNLAQTLQTQSFSKEQLEALIVERSNSLEQILGITVAYQPYGFNETTELYAPYYDKKQGKTLLIDELYDYTDSSLQTSKWYVDVVNNGKAWVEPYYAQGAQALVADYGIPFYHTSGIHKGTVKGIVSMTISLEMFAELIHALSLGKTGYGFVASEKGAILAHPVGDYAGNKTITDLKEQDGRDIVKSAYEAIETGNAGNIEFYDEIKKQETLFFYDKVPVSEWRIGVVFFKNDLLGGETILKKKYINISIVASLLLFFLLAIFYNRDFLSEREIWYLGFFAGFVLLGNIILVGYLQHSAIHTTEDALQSPPVTDINTLNSIVNEQNLRADKLGREERQPIPTGIYVERLYFEDSYSVGMSGQIWQKYPNDILDEVTTGFALPQTAPFAEAQLLEERSRQKFDEYTLVTYAFRNTFRLNFEYDKYPFDRRNIEIYLQPLSFKDRLLFVPDLESYTFTNPSQRSGISKKISLSGSKILETYFSYEYYTYDANFGAPVSGSNQPVPELHFNIKLKRILITSFVTYLIPIFVTLIMMFMLIYTIKKKEDKEVDGNIVSAMTAFFFVLIFSHIDLRKSIDTAELIYMEYFYFVTYIMILLSTYNLIAYSRAPHKIFSYKDNLIVKATFWPLFLLMMLVITLFMFY